ncbi:conserved hypothetical protein [Theileria orientalis strain Shintoku]|uniref:Uncharacterized protein n=1 Tax=Theileria orientalis strain Shintoku TaxID=869250 RepID=J4C3G6_THEOR|nr:conserved hypothetical protein [Theileria orientalis strain Shintoku]BAM40406.1 conserved hypothetical protein [Theileria orientalis strain Shintoku]|eukprot:XP_009690707.1 conserved hypothetical protein [Theileria orientalis strain Shintoku]
MVGLLSTQFVFGDAHLSSTSNLVTPNHRTAHENALPHHKSLTEIYKRKHNVNSGLNLHPTVTKSVKSTNAESTKAEDVNDFLVYYPEKVNHEEEKKEKSDLEQRQLPLILGSIGAGVYPESKDSLMSLKEALGSALSGISRYFREVTTRNLNNFFDAVDNYAKNNNGGAIFDINEYPF